MVESSTVRAFEMTAVGEPQRLVDREVHAPGAGQVLVRVAACGVCHTDLGFFYDGVRTRHPLPLTLGHEISGVVELAGAGAEHLAGQAVVVPAVIPCGTCDVCARGLGNVCPKQVFPGNDLHGGFATHVVVPAHGLCVVPGYAGDADAPLGESGVSLRELSVLADAVSTPWQSIRRSGLAAGDLAVFVGVGGVGGFGVQLAAALGAHVIALDVSDARLERIADFGACRTLNVRDLSPRDVKKRVGELAHELSAPRIAWRIFETSGTAAGQTLAFNLINHAAYLGVVGFTLDRVEVRLSNLMAFDAKAEGVWGCLPELYPSALDLILRGKVRVAPFVTRHPLSSINETFEALHAHTMELRPVLVPDL